MWARLGFDLSRPWRLVARSGNTKTLFAEILRVIDRLGPARHATFTQTPGGPVKTYKDCNSIFRMLARSPSQCSSERAQICALGTSWSR